MTSIFDLLYIFTSNKRLTKQDRKKIKDIYERFKEDEELMKKIDQDFNTGWEDDAFEHVHEFLTNLKEMLYDVEDVEQHTMMHLFDARNKAVDIRNAIEEVKDHLKNNRELEAKVSLDNALSVANQTIKEINDVITKVRAEAADANYNRDHFVAYKTLMSLLHTIQVLFRLEKHLRKDMKVIKIEFKNTKQFIEELKKGKHLSHPEEINKHLKLFHEIITQSISELSEVSHDDIILVFFIKEQLNIIHNVILKLSEAGFSKEKGVILHEEFQKDLEEFKTAVYHIKQVGTLLKQRSQKRN